MAQLQLQSLSYGIPFAQWNTQLFQIILCICCIIS